MKPSKRVLTASTGIALTSPSASAALFSNAALASAPLLRKRQKLKSVSARECQSRVASFSIRRTSGHRLPWLCARRAKPWPRRSSAPSRLHALRLRISAASASERFASHSRNSATVSSRVIRQPPPPLYLPWRKA